MTISIDDLFNVFDRVKDELGDEGADGVVGLAEIGLGGYFWNDPGTSIPPTEELVAMIATGHMYEQGCASLRRRLTYLIEQENFAEDLLVTGVVHHVTRRMEDFSEDMSKSTAKTRDEYEEHRKRLQDPAEREAQASRINAILPPEVPRVSADDLLGKLDQMLEEYAPPIDADQLREARLRFDTWRRAVREVLGDELRL